MIPSRAALALLGILAAGCMTVPARYRQPSQVYTPRLDRLAVASFQRTEFVQMGGFSGAVGGNNVFGAASGWSGDYRTFSDAERMRWFLEETHCARQVDETHDAPLRVEGEAHGERRYGVGRTAVTVVEAFTLLPFFGLPVPGAADGSALVRLYRDNEFVTSMNASTRLPYWTTVYTHRRDDATAAAVARTMALREVADQVAANLCGAHRAP